MQHGRLGETENNDPGWKQAEPCQLAPKDLRSQFCHDGISSGVHQEEAGQPLPPNRTLLPSTPTICDESLKDRHSGVFFLGVGLVIPLSSPQATKSRSPLSRNTAQSGRVRLGRWVTGDSRVRRERQRRKERGEVSKGKSREGD